VLCCTFLLFVEFVENKKSIWLLAVLVLPLLSVAAWVIVALSGTNRAVKLFKLVEITPITVRQENYHRYLPTSFKELGVRSKWLSPLEEQLQIGDLLYETWLFSLICILIFTSITVWFDSKNTVYKCLIFRRRGNWQ